MKFCFSSFLLLVFAFGVFGQNYQQPDKDIGADLVVVTAVKSNLRDFASTNSKVITTFPKETRLILVTRNESEGFYEVANIYTLEKGWMHKSTIQIFLTNLKGACPNSSESYVPPPVVRVPKPISKTIVPKGNGDSVFTEEYVGGNSEPTLEIENRTVKTLTFNIGGVSYYISSGKTQTINLEPGTYSYTVTAPGVRDYNGTDGFGKNYRYTWAFTIVTRTVPR